MPESHLAENGKMMDANHGGFMTPNTKYLNTQQIGRHLGLAAKTVRKLCNNGDIVAKKLAGGEWRTTQEDLDRSPYLRNRNRREHATLE
ncbi:MAG: helix-turn-helix domain-containing protein [Phycisphaerales bacterium]|nr:helix-turn-helix domain-containing protein [Phycisphaerales bacterium]